MKPKIILPVLVLLCGFLFFYLGCVLEKTGTLRINLTDDPGIYDEVVITFSEIAVHQSEEQDETDEQDDIDNQDNEGIPRNAYGEDDGNDDNDGDNDDSDNDGNWIIIKLDEEIQYDLLKLQDTSEIIAIAELGVGFYTQIRLKIVEGIDKTFVKIGDTIYPLEVPSGAQSGLKLTHPFEIVEDGTTIFYLDFDAEKSVVETGNEQYKLKPTIKILSQGVKGIVVDSDEDPIAGATVSASDDDVDTESCSTGDYGTFELPLAEGIYTVEITAESYNTETIESVEVTKGEWVNLGSIQLELE
jgi:hypothetical protein